MMLTMTIMTTFAFFGLHIEKDGIQEIGGGEWRYGILCCIDTYG